MIKDIQFDGFNYKIETDGGIFQVAPFKVHENILNSDVVEFISIAELFKYFGTTNTAKNILLKKVSLYDSSSAVNSFEYNGKNYWLDKSLRSSLFNLYNNADPEEEFEIVFGDIVIKEKAKVLKTFINQLERYAYECFIVTLKHLNEINLRDFPKDGNELKVIEMANFLRDYDYTTGYPEKIKL